MAISLSLCDVAVLRRHRARFFPIVAPQFEKASRRVVENDAEAATSLVSFASIV
jgi:hypothetical protein